ncbi:MAG: LytR/AlgR family response regulator transcription factor [Bacteroidia bacterium]
MNAIIIDDENDAVASLKLLLEEFCTNINVVAIASNLLDGIKIINTHKPDIVFLDIELSTNSGFELLSYFPNRNFHVIFVTAYESYAIKAIKHDALDYLLKPIDIDELQETISKLQSSKSTIESIDTNQPGSKAKQQKISVFTSDGIIYISIKDIIHIKAEGSYSIIYLKDQKPVVASKNLKEFEKLLPIFRFFRVHNSHLINLRYVEKYVKSEGGKIIMTDKAEIEISRNKKDQFFELMNRTAL